MVLSQARAALPQLGPSRGCRRALRVRAAARPGGRQRRTSERAGICPRIFRTSRRWTPWRNHGRAGRAPTSLCEAPTMRFQFAGSSLLVIAAVLVSAPAFAEDAVAHDVDEVVVTGTRRADVTVLNAVTPIDVVGEDALRASGSQTVVQGLRATVPSATFAQTGGIIGARLANSVSLRGLPAGNTLVLLNGKRRTPTAKVSTGNEWSRGSQPVDLNDIPLEAIGRVEVLRDGASAQYGSDAIAGVVNVILRGDEPGGFLQGSYGQYYEGDGETRDISGWYTLPLADKGFVNASLHLRDSGTTDRDNPDIRAYYFPGDPREATVDKDFGFYGNPDAKSAVGGLNGEYALSDNVTAYGFGTAAYRKSVARYRIRPAADNNVRGRFRTDRWRGSPTSSATTTSSAGCGSMPATSASSTPACSTATAVRARACTTARTPPTAWRPRPTSSSATTTRRS